ncbi:MAG: hypothetical protein KAS67_07790 [Thermoplasmata archaeon]|nr:hypothetical protein [Thermoplasmata archaeon]
MSQEKVTGQDPQSIGRALQKIFRQEDLLGKIEVQDSTLSLLMNDARRDIFFHLLKEPCDHLRGVAKFTGTSPSSARWHLQKMVELEYTGSSNFRNRTVYWVDGMVEPGDVELLALLKDSHTSSIVRHLFRSPKLREIELTKLLDTRQQVTFTRLRSLLRYGVVEASGPGYGKKYSLSPLIFELQDRYNEKPLVYQERIARLLVDDGLKPRLSRRSGSKIYIKLKLPGRVEKRMVECNPFIRVLLM